MGAGLGRKGGAIRWNKAGQIVTGWFFTLPAAGLVGAISAYITMTGPFGILIDAILTVAVILTIFQMSRRNKIGHHNVLSEVEGASEVGASPRQVRAAARKAAAAAKKAKKKGGNK
jgi:PiT family inorganic phosphate transporter